MSGTLTLTLTVTLTATLSLTVTVSVTITVTLIPTSILEVFPPELPDEHAAWSAVDQLLRDDQNSFHGGRL